MKKTNCLLASLLAVGSFLVANVSNAAPVSYNIIQSQSTLTVLSKLTAGGGLINQTATKQIAVTDQGGSDKTTYTGTINADLVPGTSIQLLSANMLADLQTVGAVPVAISPDVGGAGSSPANYGFNTAGPIIAALQFALRNVSFSVSSPVLAINGLGNFPSTTWTDTGLTGVTDISGTASQIPVGGLSATNSNVLQSSVFTIGTTEFLKLQYKMVLNVLVDPTNQVFSNTTFSGTILSSRTVPEPGTMVLGGMALACLVPVGLRRYRRR